MHLKGVKSLYSEKLVKFQETAARWEWDLVRIQERDITDNVVEFMAEKTRKMQENTCQALTLAACLGNRFDLHSFLNNGI